MIDIVFADKPSKFVYDDSIWVEFLPADTYFGTRGPDCVLFYDKNTCDCVHVHDGELAEFYRRKVAQ